MLTLTQWGDKIKLTTKKEKIKMSNKTRKPQNALWQTNPTERKSYYFYFFGQNMIYNMIAAYLTTFLLLLGVNPAKSAAVMLVVKVWDAVNDALFVSFGL